MMTTATITHRERDEAMAYLQRFKGASTDPLRRAAVLVEVSELLLRDQVNAARRDGATWGAIGDTIGLARGTTAARYRDSAVDRPVRRV